MPAFRISSLNIQEIEPAYPKDAFVATIMPVVAISFPVMDAGSSHMSQPPEQEKKHQQEPVHSPQFAHVAGLPIPATTFPILKRGFDAPS